MKLVFARIASRKGRGHAPNAVELIPILGALFPRGGPVQEPVHVLTGR